ncbi:SCO family protein [Streptomonospora salina]|uniref:Protein SCO1/2 n=1 Tax=Streptomonospora salina TaxID=104205 RepID=A0A841EJQ2_9ACTN|nr:SCO family protein [Streptomonospora salina]MBB6001018.1 protein SCO1/2 [Streptomonospora salina]
MSEQHSGVLRSRLLAAGAAAAAAVALAGCGGTGEAQEPGQRGPFLEVAETAMPAPSYEFSTTEGDPWSFGDVAQEKLTLLYFGYTSCPDVCPTTMADVAAALEGMGPAADGFDVVMVSTDPDRDTPEQLRGWLDSFDPGFTGVRGPIDDVVDAAEAYGIPVDKPEKTEGDYLVSHGQRVAVLDGAGSAVGFFDEGTAPDDMGGVLSDLAQERL